MQTYATITELLAYEGPGLQDYVTRDELNRLIDGTMAPAGIADRYIEDLINSTLVAVETNADETRADLLAWLRSEIEIAVEQRQEDAREQAQQNKLNAIRHVIATEKRLTGLIHHRKAELAHEAREMGISKAAIADALEISRPTLDKWLAASSR
jgi:DNA invertase Pin-like site-specific DNA recombinase